MWFEVPAKGILLEERKAFLQKIEIDGSFLKNQIRLYL